MTTPGRIEISGLTKVFHGGVRAVDSLTFAVEPGSVTGFLGPNGAGKTTTLRMLLGLVRPTAGTATIGGLTYSALPAPLTTVGAALESSSFHPARTARNHLRIMCTAAGLPDDRADAALGMVGLTPAADRKVRAYSLGMRQRLGLAAALLGDPHVLVLDEPANGLDPDGIRWLRGFFRHLADRGRTILVSSHQLNEVQEVADRVVILDRGRLVTSGSIAELSAGAQRVLVRTPTPDALGHALAAQNMSARRVDAMTLEVGAVRADAVGHVAFTAGVELHELTQQRFDLEAFFFALTTQPPGAAGPPPGFIAPPGYAGARVPSEPAPAKERQP